MDTNRIYRILASLSLVGTFIIFFVLFGKIQNLLLDNGISDNKSIYPLLVAAIILTVFLFGLSILGSSKQNTQDKYAKKTKVLKAVSICLLYEYIDYALELFYMIPTVFDKHERQIIEKMLKRNVRYESKIPHFKGKHLIASIFNYFYEVWKPTHDRWATVNRKLGNL